MNQLYVTNAAPTATKLFHTLFDIGCRLGGDVVPNPDWNPGIDENAYKEALFQAIWQGFSTNNTPSNPTRAGVVIPMAPAPLKYWGADANNREFAGAVGTPENFTAAALLKDADGRCGAWSQLFNEVVKAQGLAAVGAINVDPPPIPGMFDPSLYMKSQLTAQNNATPPYKFANHTFRMREMPEEENAPPNAPKVYEIFDPSYGLRIEAPITGIGIAWENAALDKIVYKYFLNGQVETYTVHNNQATAESAFSDGGF